MLGRLSSLIVASPSPVYNALEAYKLPSMGTKSAAEASPAAALAAAPMASAPAAPSIATTKPKRISKPPAKSAVAKTKTPMKAPSPAIRGKKRKKSSKQTPAKGKGAKIKKRLSKPSTSKKATKADKPATPGTGTGTPDTTASKDDKKQGKHAGGRPKKDFPDASPFKQISVLGLPPAPVVVLARRDDVTLNFRRSFPLAPRKSRAKPRAFIGLLSSQQEGDTGVNSPTATGGTPAVNATSGGPLSRITTSLTYPTSANADGRVALRVIPGGQVPSRFKRPNDGKDESMMGAKKLKTKSGRPSSAAAGASSGIAPAYNGRSKLTPEWHPGMHTVNGITLVEPNLTIALPPPAPLVQEGNAPPRYRPMRLTATDFPQFDQQDGTRASIQYLRYIALAVGRINPTSSGRLQHSFNGEQRVFRERLTRVLLARDGRHADKVRAGGTRRSTRTRFAPDAFVPSTADGGRNSAYGYYGDGDEYEIGAGGVMIQSFDPTEMTDVRMGPTYQTELPQQRPRPLIPEKEESRWVENLVLEAGKAVHSTRVERTESMTCACEDNLHAEAIARQVSQLAEAVGPSVAKAFGLGTMGTETAKNLTEEQQDQLYEGITKHGRGFYKISKEFLGGNVRPRILAAYYYDVWKLSGIPAAKRWFAGKVEEEEQRIAEEKAQEVARAGEAAKRSKSMEASHRRRQVKDAVYWIRVSAKNPYEVNFNKSVVRERATRAVRISRDIVQAAGAPSPVAVVS